MPSDPNRPRLTLALVGGSKKDREALVSALASQAMVRGVEAIAGGIQSAGGTAFERRAVDALRASGTFQEFESATRTYTVFVASDHSSFMKSLIAGEVLVVGAILIASADEPEPPGTHDELALLKQLQVTGLVALMDTTGVDADVEVQVGLEETLLDLLETASLTEPRAPIIRASIQRGDSLGDLFAALDQHIPAPIATADRPLLMEVNQVIGLSGGGTVALGKIERGRVRTGDPVGLVGGKTTHSSVVTGVERFRELVDAAEAGDRVGLLLRGLTTEDITPGMCVIHPGSITAHEVFTAQACVLDLQEATGRSESVVPDTGLEFQFRSERVRGRLTGLGLEASLRPGAIVQWKKVVLSSPVALEVGQHFTAYASGRPIAVGFITRFNAGLERLRRSFRRPPLRFAGETTPMPTEKPLDQWLADLVPHRDVQTLDWAGPASRMLRDTLNSEEHTASLVASAFWQGYVHSEAFTAALKTLGLEPALAFENEIVIVGYGPGQYSLLVTHPQMQKDIPLVIPAEATRRTLTGTWEVLERNRRESGWSDPFVPGIMSAASVEAGNARDFWLVISKPIEEEKTNLCDPARQVTSGVMLSTAGACVQDRFHRNGVTAAFHSVPKGTLVLVDGLAANYIEGDLMTDSCFLECAVPGNRKNTHGPLKLAPRVNEVASYEGCKSSGPARVVAFNYELPYIDPNLQQTVRTEMVTRQGDSGAALLDTQGYILGFAYSRNANVPGTYSSWIWADAVFERLGLRSY